MKVYLAMPTYTGRPDIETQASLLLSQQELSNAGIDFIYKPLCGNSIIPVARNQAVADFLASDCTDMVMLDDDVAWEDGALLRLLSHPVDVVGGAYPKRQDKLEFPIKRLPGAGVDMATGLMEVRSVPGGFLRMTRQCLEAMTAHYAHLRCYDRAVKGRVVTALFWNELWPGVDADSPADMPEPWGEDFVFCKRWRDMGGKVWLDTLLCFKHIGRKAWTGCYAATMPVAALFDAAAAE